MGIFFFNLLDLFDRKLQKTKKKELVLQCFIIEEFITPSVGLLSPEVGHTDVSHVSDVTIHPVEQLVIVDIPIVPIDSIHPVDTTDHVTITEAPGDSHPVDTAIVAKLDVVDKAIDLTPEIDPTPVTDSATGTDTHKIDPTPVTDHSTSTDTHKVDTTPVTDHSTSTDTLIDTHKVDPTPVTDHSTSTDTLVDTHKVDPTPVTSSATGTDTHKVDPTPVTDHQSTDSSHHGVATTTSSDPAPHKDLPLVDVEPTPAIKTVAELDSGKFIVTDKDGTVTVDFLSINRAYRGQLGIFSLSGLEDYDPNSTEFIKEAATRALSNSTLGGIAIDDHRQGARFGTMTSDIPNTADYTGPTTITLKPGDSFGIILVPKGTLQLVAQYPGIGGDARPLFSLAGANPAGEFQMGQIADIDGQGRTFAIEDKSLALGSDKDYNDVIFQVRGAYGKAATMDSMVNPSLDWRGTELGQKLMSYIQPPANQPIIGVIDTGFTLTNPSIDPYLIHPLHDYVAGDSNPFLAPGEGSSHGDMVTGIIAGQTPETPAPVVVGTPASELLSGDGSGTTPENPVPATTSSSVITVQHAVIKGINDQAPIYESRAVGSGQWAKALVEFVDVAKESGQHNAIANLSFDLTKTDAQGHVTTRYEFTPQEISALEYAQQNKVVIVASAGNTGGLMSALGQSSQHFDNIITVGSGDSQGRYDYSSYGQGLDIIADGGTSEHPVVSSLGATLGTSVAAAKVTGAASQVWAANPELSYQQVITILEKTATDVATPGWDAQTGAGLLNVTAAVQLAKGVKWGKSVIVNGVKVSLVLLSMVSSVQLTKVLQSKLLPQETQEQIQSESSTATERSNNDVERTYQKDGSISITYQQRDGSYITCYETSSSLHGVTCPDPISQGDFEWKVQQAIDKVFAYQDGTNIDSLIFSAIWTILSAITSFSFLTGIRKVWTDEDMSKVVNTAMIAGFGSSKAWDLASFFRKAVAANNRQDILNAADSLKGLIASIDPIPLGKASERIIGAVSSNLQSQWQGYTKFQELLNQFGSDELGRLLGLVENIFVADSPFTWADDDVPSSYPEHDGGVFILEKLLGLVENDLPTLEKFFALVTNSSQMKSLLDLVTEPWPMKKLLDIVPDTDILQKLLDIIPDENTLTLLLSSINYSEQSLIPASEQLKKILTYVKDSDTLKKLLRLMNDDYKIDKNTFPKLLSLITDDYQIDRLLKLVNDPYSLQKILDSVTEPSQMEVLLQLFSKPAQMEKVFSEMDTDPLILTKFLNLPKEIFDIQQVQSIWGDRNPLELIILGITGTLGAVGTAVINQFTGGGNTPTDSGGNINGGAAGGGTGAVRNLQGGIRIYPSPDNNPPPRRFPPLIYPERDPTDPSDQPLDINNSSDSTEIDVAEEIAKELIARGAAGTLEEVTARVRRLLAIFGGDATKLEELLGWVDSNLDRLESLLSRVNNDVSKLKELLRLVPDPAVLEQLLKVLGNDVSKLEELLKMVLDPAQLERLLALIGNDISKLEELLKLASDSVQLEILLSAVDGDIAKLEELLRRVDNNFDRLESLLRRVNNNLSKLDELLGMIPDSALLYRLLALLSNDIPQLERLLKLASDPGQLERLLMAVGSAPAYADQLERFLTKVPDPNQLEYLLKIVDNNFPELQRLLGLISEISLGVGGNGIASEFGDLSGLDRDLVDKFLRSLDRNVRILRGEEYTRYRFSDGSQVTIENADGRVVREPAPQPDSVTGRNLNQGKRLGRDGSLLQTIDEHGYQIPGTNDTGERVYSDPDNSSINPDNSSSNSEPDEGERIAKDLIARGTEGTINQVIGRLIILSGIFNGNVAKLEELLKRVDYNLGRLEGLLRGVDNNVSKLEELLGKVYDSVQLNELLVKVPNRTQLESLLLKVSNPATLLELLDAVKNDVPLLERLLTKVGDAPKLENLLKLANYDAEKLENLLNSERLTNLMDNNISKLEDLLKRVGNYELPSIIDFAKAQDVLNKLQKLIDDRIPVGRLRDNLKSLATAVNANDAMAVTRIINSNLKGSVREVEAAIVLQKREYTIQELGKKIIDETGEEIGEIDIVSIEVGKLVYNEVKSGNAANLGSGSSNWSKFTAQVDRIIEHAKQDGASVRYMVDIISTDAEEYIRNKANMEGVEIIEIYRFEN